MLGLSSTMLHGRDRQACLHTEADDHTAQLLRQLRSRSTGWVHPHGQPRASCPLNLQDEGRPPLQDVHAVSGPCSRAAAALVCHQQGAAAALDPDGLHSIAQECQCAALGSFSTPSFPLLPAQKPDRPSTTTAAGRVGSRCRQPAYCCSSRAELRCRILTQRRAGEA